MHASSAVFIKFTDALQEVNHEALQEMNEVRGEGSWRPSERAFVWLNAVMTSTLP